MNSQKDLTLHAILEEIKRKEEKLATLRRMYPNSVFYKVEYEELNNQLQTLERRYFETITK